MRRHALAVALLALLAGCALPGAVPDLPPPPALPAPPPLPQGAALEPGERVASDATSASFAWSGVLERGTVSAPFFGPAVSRDAALAKLRLPAGAPLHVAARLTWTGAGDLDLRIFDDEVLWCHGAAREGGTLARAPGEERCHAFVDAGAARAWDVSVSPHENLAEDVAFELTVRVGTYAPAPRYDPALGPRGRAEVPDPSAPGPHATRVAEYDFGALVVEDRGTRRPYPVRVLGAVHFPSAGEGPFPVAIFLHGRHDACEGTLGDVGPTGGVGSHCRGLEPLAEPVRSHRGYDDVAMLLASHGIVVASIDANDINAMDSPAPVARGDDGIDARARLLLRTLDELRGVHERGGSPTNPALDALRGRLDLERVGLMGHSRGAEGVTRAQSLADETGHWAAGSLRAVYALAGTTRFGLLDYAPQPLRAPLAYAAVLPYCDGDVEDLGGATPFDLARTGRDRASLVQVLVMGANHNGYNAMWPEDDASYWQGDPYCAADLGGEARGYGRLAPEDQLAHQRVHLAGFLRLHLQDERAFAPLFTGEAEPPASACPAGLSRCPGLFHVSFHPAEGILLVEDAAADDALARNDLGGASSFEGFASAAWCDPAAGDEACAYPVAVGAAPRLRLAWDEGGRWRSEIPEGAREASTFDTLAFRVGLEAAPDTPPGGVAPRIHVALEDERGARAEVDLAAHGLAAFAPPGAASRRVVLDQARVPLDAFAGVDLARVAAIEIGFKGGSVRVAHVADLALLDLRRSGAS